MIVSLNVVAIFPAVSSAATVTAGEITAPDDAFDGPCVNTNWLAAPAPIANGLLVAVPSAVALAVSVYVPATAAIASVLNVATPFTATCVLSVNVSAVPVVNASVIFAVDVVTTLPPLSSTDTATAAIVAPDGVSVGSCVNANWLAVPTLIANELLVTVG